MNDTEATSNIVIAMINNNRLLKTEQVVEAYKEIFKAINNPLKN